MGTTTTRATPRAGEARSRLTRELDDTEVWLVLGAAMVVAAAVLLWVGRETAFSVDEVSWFSTSPHLGLRDAIEPYNGHLIVTTRVVYAFVLTVFGSAYLPFRVLTAGAVLLTAGLFFVFARRRVGAPVAVAPTLVLLVYGSDSLHTISGNGFTVLVALAAGIGALLALERADRAGDIGACLLLCLAVLTYSEGLPFLAAGAVLIVLGADRWRRAWVFVVPALVYGAWLLWSNTSSAGGADTGSNVALANALLVPSWAFDSLANDCAALFGLNYEFGESGGVWGAMIATLALAALGWRLWRGSVPRWLWATLAVPASLWVIEAMAADPAFRGPDDPRYVYPGTIAVLLVAVEAARGVRFRRDGLIVLYLLVVLGMSTNLALLRKNATQLRTVATATRSDLAAVEMAGGRLPPKLGTGLLVGVLQATGEGNVATGYIDAVREFGSPAFSLPEVRAQGEPTRELVDGDLAGSYGLALRPGRAPPGRCRRAAGGTEPGGGFRLPPGGAVLRANGKPAVLRLRRFGTNFSVSAGTLAPGEPATLTVPRDVAPDPWYASASGGSVEICGPPPGASK